ncbi:DUF4123 domain-containing protein [Agrobacterium vitis]
MNDNLVPSLDHFNVPASIIKEYLWKNANDDLGVWVILDGQWIEGIVIKLLENNVEYCSLFEGPLTQEHLAASPYLVKLSPHDSFTTWILESGWGHGWGIFFQASPKRIADLYPNATTSHIALKRAKGEFFGSEGLESQEERLATLLLRKHFRKYSRVSIEGEGRVVAFRFFDPGVLQTWLRSANNAELASFMQPIRSFLIEDYCDVQKLNRPERLHIYSFNSTSESSLSARQYDHKTSKISQLSRYSASGTGTLNIGENGLMLLREPVRRQFERRQLTIFKEEIVEDVVTVRSRNGLSTDISELRQTVDFQVEKANSFGLRSRRNLANYVLCYFRYGNDFVSTIPDFQKAFADRVSDKEVEPILAKFAKEDRLAGELIA